MMRRLLMLTGFAALAACGRDRGRDLAVSDSLSRELEVAARDTASLEKVADSARPTEQRRTRVGARPVAPYTSSKRTSEPSLRKRPAAPEPDPRTATAAPPEIPDTQADSVATTPRGYSTSSSAMDTLPTPADTARPPEGTRTTPLPSSDSARDTATAPAATRAPASASANAHALPAGTHIRALLEDSIHSLRNSAGQSVTALVSGDVRAPDGSIIVPSGSAVRLTIARLRPARTRSAADGELELRPDSIIVAGRGVPVSAEVQAVPHELKGRGVTAGEAEKVAAGAAVGAVAGGVITGKTKGAVIGGAVGAAGGAVVAAQTASRDVVVAPKTMLVLVLTAPLLGRAR